MRKKYLSALLFGALLFASAGTFTSCKDYDDEINDLQEQITDVKNAVAELEKAIGAGKYVTDVVADGNGLKFTWNDETTTVIGNVINGEGQGGDVVEIDPETGEIKINNEGTGFYASKGEGETPEFKAPYVNENGVLVLINEKGEEVVTGIRVSPVTAVVNPDGSAVLTIIGADGTKQEVKVPSAASMIQNLVVSGAEDGIVPLGIHDFEFKLKQADGTTVDLTKIRADWDGAKTLPADDSHVLRTVEKPEKFGLRIDPITIDATAIDFTLVNSANETLSGLNITAEANDKPLTGTPDSRAASKGGIYDLTAEDVFFSKKEEADKFFGKLQIGDENVNFALAANGGARSSYNIQVSKHEDPITEAVSPIKITTVDGTSVTNGENNGGSSSATNVTLDKNTLYKIKANSEEVFYDMMISADAEAVANYGLEIDKDNYTLKITKDADVSTVGKFKFNVITVSVDGFVKEYNYNVTLSDKINTPVEYDEIKHNISAKENFFSVDLATMKNSMSAEELNTWKTRVNLSNTAYTIHKVNADGSCGEEVAQNVFGDNNLFKALISDKNVSDAGAVTEKDKANFVVVNVDNEDANSNIKLFTKYFMKVVFKTTDNSEINSILVPIQFTAPTVAELYEVKSGLYREGVVYGFFSKQREGYGSATYTIVDAFSKYVEDATYTATDDKIEGTQIPSNNDEKGIKVVNGTVSFVQAPTGEENEVQDAYDKAFTLKATKDNYAGWEYATAAQKEYKFKMKLLSPIYSGSFLTNGKIEVNGGQAYTITNAQLKVTDYNTTSVNILHDAIVDGKAGWSDNRLYEVSAEGVTGQLTNATVVSGKVEDGKLTEGVISGRANSVATDADSKITIKVKDIFGYIKTFELPVTVKANK